MALDLDIFHFNKNKTIITELPIEDVRLKFSWDLFRLSRVKEFNLTFDKSADDSFSLLLSPSLLNAKANLSIKAQGQFRPLASGGTEISIRYKGNSIRANSVRVFIAIFWGMFAISMIQSKPEEQLRGLLISFGGVLISLFLLFLIKQKTNHQIFLFHNDIVDVLNVTSPSSAHN